MLFLLNAADPVGPTTTDEGCDQDQTDETENCQ